MNKEPKVAKDYEERARHILTLVANRAHMDMTDRRVRLLFDENTIGSLSSDLLEIYQQGWDDRSTQL